MAGNWYGNNNRGIPIEAYYNGAFYDKYKSMSAFARFIGSSRAAGKLAGGWTPTERSLYHGWSIKKLK